jgi:galactokinase
MTDKQSDDLRDLRAAVVAQGDLFAPGAEIVMTRAPGRLDLMGGIADYSGSLVLQYPLAQATRVAFQWRQDRRLRLRSLVGGQTRSSELTLDDLTTRGIDGPAPLDYALARRFFAADPAHHWAAYVAGTLLVLWREEAFRPSSGASILITSDVPEGKGVSSSAALEVAVMMALVAAAGLTIEPRRLAILCQKVENLVAGAPCGLMDQMTSVAGEEGKLLALLCQPARLLDPVALPAGLAIWGIDSGVRHAVTGADYGQVRTAAFMGYRMIAALAGLPVEPVGLGRVRIEDSRWHGYLANLGPTEFYERYAAHLPARLSGADFLDHYHGITDPVTEVDPERVYPVFDATRHPVEEHHRVARFADLLRGWSGEADSLALGEMMYQSHASYSACGLGADGTDRLVELVRAAGPAAGLYGAKITGGGSGGTVAVLGRAEADPAVAQIAATYGRATGHQPLIISGSSPGAVRFGTRRWPPGRMNVTNMTNVT